VVVDNDAGGHARETVDRFRAEARLDVTYSTEPVRTIPAARNHALRLAQGNYIGIIDDDEFPPPYWLMRMYEGIQTFAVDGVLAPVYPFFAEAPPAWLVRSGLCELPVYRTGTVLHWDQTRTGNVLVRKEVFDQHGLAFDLSFRTGGSDQEFFRQAMARGYQFVAIADAPVYEVVPPVRWTRKYWIRRALVNGFNARRYASGGTGKTGQVLLTLRAFVAAAVYALAVPISIFLGHHHLMVCLQKACYFTSRFCASFGIELRKVREF
jgi:succinoglycan biosynthesis protein ExoM